MASVKIAVAFFVILLVQGCSPQHGMSGADVENVSAIPLSLKDLKTGVVYEEGHFPEAVVHVGNEVSFYYSFFGADQFFTATMNNDDVIYRYKFTYDRDMAEMREAIQDKVSIDNGKDVRFSCESRKRRLDGGMEWEIRECQIVSESQRLITTERMPSGARPAAVPVEAWRLMHTRNLVLEDVIIDNEMKEEAKDRARKKHEEDLVRAREDV